LDRFLDPGPQSDNDAGTVTLAAGEQRTIYSSNPGRSACDLSAYEGLQIAYDPTGWSPWTTTTDFMSRARPTQR
jgi:hypothetical protein